MYWQFHRRYSRIDSRLVQTRAQSVETKRPWDFVEHERKLLCRHAFRWYKTGENSLIETGGLFEAYLRMLHVI